MRRPLLPLVLLILGSLAFWLLAQPLFLPDVAAQPLQQDPTPPAPIEGSPYGDAPMQLSISDDLCLSCHSQPDLSMQLENGEGLSLYIPAEVHANSVHGEMGYACVQCHTQVGEYPHPSFSAADARDASLQLYTACKRCHTHQYELAQDSVHARALEAGNREAAICTDCHTAHDVRRLNDPETHELTPEARSWIPQTCAHCHNAIYQKYLTSVHGSALTEEGNMDVPTCIDCHGVHSIEDPTTTEFRLKSPQICSNCHTDPTVVGKYGLSTDVMETYVADFHGTTLLLFEPETPDAQFNKPVCYDCHGIHDIARADDPNKGLMVRSNLLNRCQECHPEATINFPDAWLSHYIPSPEKNPLVFYVDLFYKIFIPGVLGGMAILVALDFGRRSWNFINKQRNGDTDLSEQIVSVTDKGAHDELRTPYETEQTGNNDPLV